MIPEGAGGSLPSPDAMALLAIAAELATVYVRVAVRACRRSVGKNKLDVTLPAIHRHMQTPEWVSGFIVIELGNRTQGTPTGRRMTIRTGDSQRIVRTLGAPSHGLGLDRPSGGPQTCEHQQKQPSNEALMNAAVPV